MRKLPEQNPRVESGPVKFGDDWAGTFIRGDNAFYYASQLRIILKYGKVDVDDVIGRAALGSLLKDLESCNENTMVKPCPSNG